MSVMTTTLLNEKDDLTTTPTDNSQQDLLYLFQAHQKFYKNNVYPSYEYRSHLLKKLKVALLDRQDAICSATSKDFGNRATSETIFLEIMQIIDHINHTLLNLKSWMKPEKRRLPAHLMPGTSYVLPQPKGIVGIISPWNYPSLLSLSPLVTAISAGNTAIIKGSEYTPHTNEQLELLCKGIFNGKNASFVQGDASFAEAFCKLPFDHLFFTGSPDIGKKVMASAAQNLTPVTLELGGKSPVIIDEHYDLQKAAKAIAFGKSINAGQTCIAPDYILCPQYKIDALIEDIQNAFITMYPSAATNNDYTAIISDKHYDRLRLLLQDAEKKGAEIIPIANEQERFNIQRKIPLTIVKNTTPDMLLRQEEIFGPILPIVSTQSVEDSIAYVEAQDPPLALYLMSDDENIQLKVTQETHAGGMCINDTMTHVASQNLPFGGLRQSGVGCYHGKEGFAELSHLKSVLKRGKWNPTTLIAPPWDQKIHKLIKRLFMR